MWLNTPLLYSRQPFVIDVRLLPAGRPDTGQAIVDINKDGSVTSRLERGWIAKEPATQACRISPAWTMPFRMPIELWGMFLAIGIALALGAAYGVYPAFKASRLEPVEALRSAA